MQKVFGISQLKYLKEIILVIGRTLKNKTKIKGDFDVFRFCQKNV